MLCCKCAALEITVGGAFNALKLEFGATLRDAEKAFRSLSKIYHPDTSKKERDTADAEFKYLKQAIDKAREYFKTHDTYQPEAPEIPMEPAPAMPVQNKPFTEKATDTGGSNFERRSDSPLFKKMNIHRKKRIRLV